MPKTKGKNKIPDNVKNSSTKLISIALKLSLKPGNKEDQNRMLNGVIKKADTEVTAVRVTDKATFPLAINEKKFETLPPGHAATKIIPNAIPCGGDQIIIKRMVNAGNKTYCETNPVANAFF